MLNGYLICIVALIVFDFARHLVVEWLNLRRVRGDIPPEFDGWYDAEKYATSQKYLKETTRFDLIESAVITPLLLGFLFLGGFHVIDELARGMDVGLVPTGLVFAGVLVMLSYVLHLPFDIYSTFVIEENYGFNKTKPWTFITDQAKGLVVGGLIGGALFAAVLWFFSEAGPWAWLYSWVAVTIVQCILVYLAPVVILPLFNTFTPLDQGELRSAIEGYAREQGLSLKGIFTMDGSRRSTKSNAYVTGFGRWRRIVLFDTLVEKQAVPELVSVLAHEVGHYKLKHIQKHLLSSVLSLGLMFFLLSLFISRPGLYTAFQVSTASVHGEPPIYAGLVFFGFLYTPIAMVLSLVENSVSRRHEFAADAFAVRTYGHADAMIAALKKLSVDNFSNLAPHPLKVFMEYSHPPVLQRITALQKREREPA